MEGSQTRVFPSFLLWSSSDHLLRTALRHKNAPAPVVDDDNVVVVVVVAAAAVGFSEADGADAAAALSDHDDYHTQPSPARANW